MKAFLVGGAAGAVCGALIWWYADKQLQKELDDGTSTLAARFTSGRSDLEQRLSLARVELTAQVHSQVAAIVPRTVNAQIVETLERYHITPETGRRIDRVLRYAEQAGIL